MEQRRGSHSKQASAVRNSSKKNNQAMLLLTDNRELVEAAQ